jgi:hypothetical protein
MNIKRSFKNYFRLTALFVFSAVFLAGCSGTGMLANTAPLSTSEKNMVIAYNLVSAVDMLQTREIQSNPAFTEVNPLIGDSDSEVIGFFVAKSILHYSITRILPQEYRTGWLGISIVPSIIAIGHNKSIGVTMKF